MTRKPRLLVIAPYFPPRRRVGSLRPFRFVSHIKRNGWDVAVVYLEDRSATLTEAERTRLRGVSLWPIRPPLDRTVKSGSESDIGSSAAAGKVSTTRTTPSALDRLTSWFDRAIPVDTWLPVLLASLPTTLKRARAWAPDVIWSTANPWSSHVFSAHVASALDLPWIADFRDPWTLAEPYQKTTPNLTQRVDRQVERGIYEKATAITFTSRMTASRTIEHFRLNPEKVHVFTNSYDSDLFRFEKTHDAESGDQLNDQFEILFFGRFRETSGAHPLIRMVRHAMDERPGIAGRFVIRSAGPLPENDRLLAEELGVLEVFETFEPVPYEDSPGRLRSADLLAICKPSDRSEVVPAKLWDYIYARRPILAISDNDEVRDVIEKTGTGRHFYNHQLKVAGTTLARLVDDPTSINGSLDFAPRDREIEAFDASNIAAKLQSLLRAVSSRN